MVTYEIPEELDAQLQQTADRLGRTKQDLLHEAVIARLDEYAPEPEFTDEQIARFKRSIEQLDRGEVVTSEQVDARFRAFFDRRAAR